MIATNLLLHKIWFNPSITPVLEVTIDIFSSAKLLRELVDKFKLELEDYEFQDADYLLNILRPETTVVFYKDNYELELCLSEDLLSPADLEKRKKDGPYIDLTKTPNFYWLRTL